MNPSEFKTLDDLKPIIERLIELMQTNPKAADEEIEQFQKILKASGLNAEFHKYTGTKEFLDMVIRKTSGVK